MNKNNNKKKQNNTLFRDTNNSKMRSLYLETPVKILFSRFKEAFMTIIFHLMPLIFSNVS